MSKMVTKEQFSEEMCEAIHSVPKYVGSKIEWKSDGPSLKFRAQVFTVDGKYALELVGCYGHNPRYGRITWGFSLTFRRHVIRSYDMARKHKNIGHPGWVRGPHKHRFANSRIPRFAYKPNPPITETDCNDALIDFLKESNIEVPKDYQRHIFF
jgi:hypothetical protein